MKQFILAFVLSISLLGCGGQGLSPVQLTGDQQSDIAVREYLLASYQLAHQFGFDFHYVENTELTSKSKNINTDLFGFQLRSDIPYKMRLVPNENLGQMPITPENRTAATIYYIKTGTYASLILCRNYLSGLRDRNEYFEFLQKELNVAGGLATIAMQLASANGTIRTSVQETLTALNLGIDTYQTFRFLTPEVETILPIVALAQSKLRGHYLSEGFPTTFSGAINAVSQIEYQCTRSGVRGLINRTLVQAQPEFRIVEGILYAKPVTADPPAASPAPAAAPSTPRATK
jgi:hypothetical protein